MKIRPVQSQASVEKYINDDRTVLSAGPLGLVGHMGKLSILGSLINASVSELRSFNLA